jgi:hypothetical protein
MTVTTLTEAPCGELVDPEWIDFHIDYCPDCHLGESDWRAEAELDYRLTN